MKSIRLLIYSFFSINLSSFRVQLIRLSLFLTFVYLFYFIEQYILFKQLDYTVLIASFFFLISALSVKIYKFNRTYISKMRIITMVVVTCLTTYYHLRYGIDGGFYLFYFFNLISIPFLMNFKLEEKSFYVMLFFTFIIYSLSFFGDSFNNFGVEQVNLTEPDKSFMFKANIVLNLILCLHTIIALVNIQNQINFINLRRRSKKKIIEQLMLDNNKIKESDLLELKTLIAEKNLFFIAKFEKTFPEFMQRLSELNQSDKEICALTKLRLDTKDIARFYNCSVKSIENRKYRIRKKMNVENGVRFEKFINEM